MPLSSEILHGVFSWDYMHFVEQASKHIPLLQLCQRSSDTSDLFLPRNSKYTSAVNIPIDFKWEHRRILQIIVDADFVNSASFIFARTKDVLLTVQGQRMWNVEFVTISPTHTKLHISMH